MLLNYSRKLMCLFVCLTAFGFTAITRPEIPGGGVRYKLTNDVMELYQALITLNDSGLDAQVFITHLGHSSWEYDIYILSGNPTGNNYFVGDDAPFTGPWDWLSSYDRVMEGPWWY